MLELLAKVVIVQLSGRGSKVALQRDRLAFHRGSASFHMQRGVPSPGMAAPLSPVLSSPREVPVRVPQVSVCARESSKSICRLCYRIGYLMLCCFYFVFVNVCLLQAFLEGEVLVVWG